MAPKKKQKVVEEESEEESFTVEKIVDDKTTKKGLQYLVKWEGYPSSDNTWEPADSLDDCQEAIAAYNTKKNGGTAKPKAAPKRAPPLPPKTATRSAPLPERPPPEARSKRKAEDEAPAPAPKKAATQKKIDASKLSKMIEAEVNTPAKLKALKGKAAPAAKPKPAPKAEPKKKDAVQEVDKIVGLRSGGKGGFEYQVQWKGGGKKAEVTWEPEDNIMDDDLVDDFEEELQQKSYGSVSIAAGAKVEVKSLDEGFENSWSEAKVTAVKGKKYTCEFSAFVDSKGKKMSDTVERARVRPPQKAASSSWTPQVGEVVEISDADCWWEVRVKSIKGKSLKVIFRVSDEVKDVTLGAKVRPCAWLKMAPPAK